MKLKKSLIAKSVAAVVMIAGAALPAFAQTTATAPVFTVNPAGIGAAGNVFTADQIAGTSTELLQTNGNGHTGSGWLSLGSFSKGGVAIGQTGLNDSYQLYVTFQIADTYRAGTGSGINTPNSINDLNSLTFQFYADTHFDDKYTAASSSGSGTAATVTGGTANDILLATGSLISGVANFNDMLGAGLNATQTFNLTAAGQAFFVNPTPFYNMAFDEFNNTSIGASVNQSNGLVAINQASGSIDFMGATTSVPEPASLSLLGLGMLGLAFANRRRAK